ncbi:MAK10-like protein [Tanacetum coccineum]
MKNVKNVLLDECNLIKVEDASTVVMVNVKEIDTISNMYHVCRNEGFDDIKIHHIGGLWVWIQFNSEKSCATFKSNESLKKLWITSQEVSPSFVVDERMIWIEICGLPLCAWGSSAFKKVANLFGKFKFFDTEAEDYMSMEIETWNINISNDIESNDSDNEDISSNRNVDLNEALDDYIQHVVEEKEVEKTPPKDPKADDSKPHGFEKGPIYNNDDVTSRAGNEDVSFSTDQVKYNHTVIHKDMAANEVVLDNSKPPSFENFIKENKACPRSSSTSRAGKYSTSFANYSRKDLKGFSFIDEMNRMIEVGGDLGYDVKVCKKSLSRLISGIDHVTRVILFGDLNEVRSESERFGSTFSCRDATIFNSFIHDTGLIDLPMGGWHFTWVNKVGSKMRKLDRFLISDDVLYSNTNLKEIILYLAEGLSKHHRATADGNIVVPLTIRHHRLVQNGEIANSYGLVGSIFTWEDLTTRFLAQFYPPGRTAKLQNDIFMFQQHQGESLSEAWTRFNDAISLPQDVPNASDHRLIKLENQLQRLMEAHLPPKPSIEVNKIASSCEICSGPHDTNYCMENPEQAFVDYASSRTDKAGGKWFTFKPEQNNLGDTYNPSWKIHPNLRWRKPQNSQNNFSNAPNRFQPNGSFSNRPFNNNPPNFNNQSNLEGLVSNFMTSQDARLSKFEADFKQQQSEITIKIDTFLKAINDRMMGALPSDMVKNSKLNVNPTSSVLSARSYPIVDPQSSSNPFKSVNAIKTCFKPTNDFQKDQL